MTRIAAAWFNLVAPPDRHATSAGLEPQAELGVNAPRLPGGTPAEAFLDREPPRPLSAVEAPDRIVEACCDVPGGERWDLSNREFTSAMGDEIRSRAEELARQYQLSVNAS